MYKCLFNIMRILKKFAGLGQFISPSFIVNYASCERCSLHHHLNFIISRTLKGAYLPSKDFVSST